MGIQRARARRPRPRQHSTLPATDAGRAALHQSPRLHCPTGYKGNGRYGCDCRLPVLLPVCQTYALLMSRGNIVNSSPAASAAAIVSSSSVAAAVLAEQWRS